MAWRAPLCLVAPILAGAIIGIAIEYVAVVLVIVRGVVVRIIARLVAAFPLRLPLLHVLGKRLGVGRQRRIDVLVTAKPELGLRPGYQAANLAPVRKAIEGVKAALQAIAGSWHGKDLGSAQPLCLP